jgi:hypothetical protein
LSAAPSLRRESSTPLVASHPQRARGVAGYESHVGTRTTFDMVNQQHTKVFVPEVRAGGTLPRSKRSPPRESIITVFEVLTGCPTPSLSGTAELPCRI